MSESGQEQDRGTNTSPNNAENNNNSNEASGPLNGGAEQTRNITVSIQYSYFTPERLAHLSNISNNDNNENNSAASGSTIANGTGPSFGIGNGGHQPDGALVLSFRDVPASTPQDRLNSFISVAAQLAMERFNRLLNRPKGISKDEFDKLPVLQVSDLPKAEGPLCSICYDEYEDEVDSTKAKRKRDSENEEESEGTKKGRIMKVRPYAQPPIMTVTHRLQMLRLLNRLLFLSLNNNALSMMKKQIQATNTHQSSYLVATFLGGNVSTNGQD